MRCNTKFSNECKKNQKSIIEIIVYFKTLKMNEQYNHILNLIK